MAFPLAGPLPDAGPQPGQPMPPLPMLGVAPPPIGPRPPSPTILDAAAKANVALMELAKIIENEADARASKIFNPLLQQALEARKEYAQPPKPSREEGASGGPLDQTPQGDVGGTPLPDLLPRLAGIGMR